MSDIEDAVVELVQPGGVTFVEVEWLLERHGIPTEGGWSIDLPGNIKVWPNMSKQFCDLIYDLLDAKRIELTNAHPLLYVADGAIPQLPIAQRPPKAGYKELHWAPALIGAGPTG